MYLNYSEAQINQNQSLDWQKQISVARKVKTTTDEVRWNHLQEKTNLRFDHNLHRWIKNFLDKPLVTFRQTTSFAGLNWPKSYTRLLSADSLLVDTFSTTTIYDAWWDINRNHKHPQIILLEWIIVLLYTAATNRLIIATTFRVLAFYGFQTSSILY